MLKEAQRCLSCQKKPCIKGCPLGVNIPGFIFKIKEQKFSEAFAIICEKSPFPLICSSVCPAKNQCEGACVRKIKGSAVKISSLEYYISKLYNKDNRYLLQKNNVKENLSKKKIAVVGSGPAGLSSAISLKKLGYNVTIYERMPKIGGMLYYGIPESRLDKSLLQQEIKKIVDFNVNIKTNVTIGKNIKLEELLNKEKFDAILFATGTWKSNKLNIPGENLKNVFSFVDFLLKIKEKNNCFEQGKLKNIAVVGGGNVAIDIARMAKKFKNVKKVYLLYRRSMNELLASKEEIDFALKENIEFKILTGVRKIVKNYKNAVKEIVCFRNKLLETIDSSGRRNFSEIINSDFKIFADAVITCTGAKSSNFFCKDPCSKFFYKENGQLDVSEKGQSLKIPQIFFCGDNVLGPSTVAKATFDGRKVANSIHEYLKSVSFP